MNSWMKQRKACLISLALAFALAACDSEPEQKSDTAAPPDSITESQKAPEQPPQEQAAVNPPADTTTAPITEPEIVEGTSGEEPAAGGESIPPDESQEPEQTSHRTPSGIPLRILLRTPPLRPLPRSPLRSRRPPRRPAPPPSPRLRPSLRRLTCPRKRRLRANLRSPQSQRPKSRRGLRQGSLTRSRSTSRQATSAARSSRPWPSHRRSVCHRILPSCPPRRG